jgi:hypothetical protein
MRRLPCLDGQYVLFVHSINKRIRSIALLTHRITLGSEGAEGGGGEIVFGRFHTKREPHKIMCLRQQFRLFRGDVHNTAPKIASAKIAPQIAKIAAACPRVIGA